MLERTISLRALVLWIVWCCLVMSLLGGCVTATANRKAVEAAYRAGRAERCSLDLKSWSDKVQVLKNRADYLLLRLKLACEEQKGRELVNDLCVDAEGK
jgi:hypothetical protein